MTNTLTCKSISAYVVSYSADGGQSWYFLGIGITETHLLIDTGVVSGSNQALFKITASDGINTTSDTSDSMFAVSQHEPEAVIQSPDDGSMFTVGQTLILRGRGYDLEDGTLADSALQWTSNLSGILGTGRTLTVPGLKMGTHVFTLRVTDSDGSTATASVNVFVGSKVHLPLILRNY